MDDLEYVTMVTKRTAALLSEGVAEHDLKTRRWTLVSHGLYRPAGLTEEQPALRIADAIGLMTDGCALGGWASRWLQGQAYCDGAGRDGGDLLVPILCGAGSQLRARRGIRPRERLVMPGELVDLDCVVVTTIARSTYDDMLDANGPIEALVAIETATSTTTVQTRTALSNVLAVYNSHIKTRGRKQAAWAMRHASTRSASPWETRTRMLVVDATGIDTWRINVPVFDLAENLLGVPDLLDEATGAVIESDGAGHREEVLHADDNVREEVFEEHGLVVTRVGAVDHSRARRSMTVTRVRAACERARGTSRRHWTLEKPTWWRLGRRGDAGTDVPEKKRRRVCLKRQAHGGGPAAAVSACGSRRGDGGR